MAVKPSSQDEQVTKYAPLVKRIAYHMMARLPASVEVDDLIQVGLIGLLDAVGRFDGTQGAQFESYATQRIRGAMLDELREADWLPRHVRQKSRQIESAIHRLEQRNGKSPTEQEISAELGMPIDQYQSMLGDVKCSQLLYYEDFSDEDSASFLERYLVDGSNDPLSVLEDRWRDAGFVRIHRSFLVSLPLITAYPATVGLFSVLRAWRVQSTNEERCAFFGTPATRRVYRETLPLGVCPIFRRARLFRLGGELR